MVKKVKPIWSLDPSKHGGLISNAKRERLKREAKRKKKK